MMFVKLACWSKASSFAKFETANSDPPLFINSYTAFADDVEGVSSSSLSDNVFSFLEELNLQTLS